MAPLTPRSSSPRSVMLIMQAIQTMDGPLVDMCCASALERSAGARSFRDSLHSLPQRQSLLLQSIRAGRSCGCGICSLNLATPFLSPRFFASITSQPLCCLWSLYFIWHGYHIMDSLITRLHSWERPYSHSKSGYIASFLTLDCFTLFHLVSLCFSCFAGLADSGGPV